MAASAPIRVSVRRLRALWLVLLFACAQAIPLLALAASDGMIGMACCKRGKDSCCRRKPMHKTPSIQAGHPCGTSCHGTPTVSPQSGPALLPLARIAEFQVNPAGSAELPVLHGSPSPSANPVRWQRPPPVQA